MSCLPNKEIHTIKVEKMLYITGDFKKRGKHKEKLTKVQIEWAMQKKRQ